MGAGAAPRRLLLNFDANWYRYLSDGAALAAHARDRANVAALQVADDNRRHRRGRHGGHCPADGRFPACLRPAWDAAVLAELGMQADCDAGIWRRVLDQGGAYQQRLHPDVYGPSRQAGDAPAARS